MIWLLLRDMSLIAEINFYCCRYSNGVSLADMFNS